MKANTPDFRLEPFIVLLLDGTSVAPTSWGLESIVMAIQYNQFTGLELKMKPYNTFTMIWFYSDNNNFSCRNYIAMIVS